MYIGIKHVKPLEDFRLLLTFDNDEQGIVDMKPYLEKGIFRELKDEAMFSTATVRFDTVEWANGADFDPESLYWLSTLVKKENA